MSNPKVFGREMTALSECAFELGISMFTLRAEEQADGTVAAYIFLRGIGSMASKVFDAANPLEDARCWLEDEASRMAREMAEIAIPQRNWSINRMQPEEPQTIELGTIATDGTGDFEGIGERLARLPKTAKWNVVAVSNDDAETVELGIYNSSESQVKDVLRQTIIIGIGINTLALPAKPWTITAKRAK